MALLHVERHGAVVLLTLDDRDRRNALSLALVTELCSALDELEADASVRALVVTGAPPAFCAGADLGELASVDEAGLRSIYEGFLRVARSPLPTVAAVNGPAVGAGMNLALAADVRLTSPSARLDARFLKIGIHPGGGHTWMLQRLAGPQVAAAAVLFGEVLDGERAAKVGVAWRCVEDPVLVDEAILLASKAAEVPRELLLRTKQTLRLTAGMHDLVRDDMTVDAHTEALEVELAAQLWSLTQR
jgi:enoyl-CoA hydratase